MLKLNAALNALSVSPDGDQVVVAGREVLKILRVSSSSAATVSIEEVCNLRAGSRLNLNTSSNDVKWCPSYSKSLIATAATNGAIVLWDLQKSVGQRQERIIAEHSRAVNRLTFHPVDPLLLSASQDGTMKLWDLRVKSVASQTFEGKSESARDVSFSPNQTDFAAAFENGTIQRWDLRMPKIYEKKLNAHNGLALTIDWHQDGRYLLSGGRDRMIKIWDMNGDQRKPLHTIQCIASVAKVGWRPHTRPPTATDFNRFSHIASCCLLTDNRIHVWDLERPYLPEYSFEDHANVTTGFVWTDPDTIWSVSKDKCFIVNKMPVVRKLATSTTSTSGGYSQRGTGFAPAQQITASTVSWTPDGHLLFVSKPSRLDAVSSSSVSGSGFAVHEALPSGGRNSLTTMSSTNSTNPSSSNPGSLPWTMTHQPSPATNTTNELSSSLSQTTLKPISKFMDPNATHLTWSGSSVPSHLNLQSLLTQLSQQEDGTLSLERSSTATTSANLDEESNSKIAAVSSYFARKIPRKMGAASNVGPGGTAGSGGQTTGITANTTSTSHPPSIFPSLSSGNAGTKKKEFSLTLFRPDLFQRGVFLDTETVDTALFVLYAENFMLPVEEMATLMSVTEGGSNSSGMPNPTIAIPWRPDAQYMHRACIHNAQICAYAGDDEMTHTWQILASVSAAHDVQDEQGTLDDPFRAALSPLFRPSIATSSPSSPRIDGSLYTRSLLHALMQWHSRRGHVQFLSHLLLILPPDLVQPYCNSANNTSNNNNTNNNAVQNQGQEWLDTYMTLLDQHQLYTIRTRLMKCSGILSPWLAQGNQHSTTFHVSCNHCFKPWTPQPLAIVPTMSNNNGSIHSNPGANLPHPSTTTTTSATTTASTQQPQTTTTSTTLILPNHINTRQCDKCHQQVNPCSVCQLPVTEGLYAWCQGCSHGGHVHHLQEWFKHSMECPTGCGHLCGL